jgi:4-hydroxy-tetrahydrodipicolinate reductase
MEKINVMVNGLPGKMATLVANAVIKDERFNLFPYSLTGPEVTLIHVQIGSTTVYLVEPAEREKFLKEAKLHNVVATDFTQPNATMENIDFYRLNEIPFVMGTTGVNMEEAKKKVDGWVSAVIAPNMAKPIIAFQAMMEYVAKEFPGILSGYNLEIEESHQATKPDTSGTAKAVAKNFNAMGIPFLADQIKMIRDPKIQIKIGVPEEHLGGHGWHTYKVTSPDETVLLGFAHNVSGRSVYIPGILDAVEYVHSKTKQGKCEMFSMIDVIKKR